MSCFEQENVKLISSLSDFLLLSLSSSILSEPFLCCRKLKLESLCKSGRRTTADFNGVEMSDKQFLFEKKTKTIWFYKRLDLDIELYRKFKTLYLLC